MVRVSGCLLSFWNKPSQHAPGSRVRGEGLVAFTTVSKAPASLPACPFSSEPSLVCLCCSLGQSKLLEAKDVVVRRITACAICLHSIIAPLRAGSALCKIIYHITRDKDKHTGAARQSHCHSSLGWRDGGTTNSAAPELPESALSPEAATNQRQSPLSLVRPELVSSSSPHR